MTTSAIPANSPAGTGGYPTLGPSGPGAPAEPAGPPGLVERLDGLDRLVRAGLGRLDQPVLDDADALLERAGQRLRLSGEHTVVTLAGGTGSGKSSLFNAICGLELSPTGMRRPMTSKAHACVWGLDGAGPLLDWLDVDKRHRYARASALDLERADASLQGLVLIDLPDHDSIQAMHRAEVDRFVTIADLLVWVVDPQKYADAALHRNYIVPFARHTGVTLIVLNQVDRLAPHEIDDCVADLRRLLEAEGLADPRIVTTAAVAEDGVHGFRDVLVDTVAARRARTERLSADVDRVAERFTGYRLDAEPPTTVDDGRRAELVQALTDAARARPPSPRPWRAPTSCARPTSSAGPSPRSSPGCGRTRCAGCGSPSCARSCATPSPARSAPSRATWTTRSRTSPRAWPPSFRRTGGAPSARPPARTPPRSRRRSASR
ncbi:hypothetical protein [Actinomadura madurae]|uniref:hypothetical protein n=1 Tax=Actinomadura madurae TaxID=1993 RepID=UPI0020D23AC3|nr:hypothetical protein [Actinomadura madurae]MCQ0009550.1 hypothetical protein [Actinomadura madurae]